MSLYLSDEEQISLIRDWLKKYGKILASGITVFLIAFIGVHAWQSYENKQAEKTSILYEKLIANIQDNNPIDYPRKSNTAYGQLIALLQAQEAIYKNDFDTAINNFNWILNHTRDLSLKQITRIRLARALLAQHKPELALKKINTIDDAIFSPLINAVKADILIDLHKNADAEKAYKLAAKTISPSATIQPIITMKLDSLITGASAFIRNTTDVH